MKAKRNLSRPIHQNAGDGEPYCGQPGYSNGMKLTADVTKVTCIRCRVKLTDEYNRNESEKAAQKRKGGTVKVSGGQKGINLEIRKADGYGISTFISVEMAVRLFRALGRNEAVSNEHRFGKYSRRAQ